MSEQLSPETLRAYAQRFNRWRYKTVGRRLFALADAWEADRKMLERVRQMLEYIAEHGDEEASVSAQAVLEELENQPE